MTIPGPHPGFAYLFNGASEPAQPLPGFSTALPFKPAKGLEFLNPNETLGEGIPSGLGRDGWNALVDQARASDMLTVAQAHSARLRKSGGEWVGACPVCATGNDRFAVNPTKSVFNCRGCCKGGRGPIDLEIFLSGCDFVAAVKQLTNTASLNGHHISSAKPTDATAQYEVKQHHKASWLWARRRPAAGSAVETYLRSRGYIGAIPPTIGYLPARGEHPHAMISAFALPNETAPGELGAPLVVRGVHLTKLLPDGSDRIREPGGKIIIGRPLGLPIAISGITDGLSLVITEGIEDALAYYADTGIGAWAAGNAPFIPSLAQSIPDYVTTVIIEQHVDTDEQAQRAVAKFKLLLTQRPVRKGERPIEIMIREARS
jgi:CHC2-type zinc finger protein